MRWSGPEQHRKPFQKSAGPVKPARHVPPYLPIGLQRLDDEGVLPDALRDGRELSRLDQLGELGSLLEGLGLLRGVGDDLRPLQLADQGALGCDLGKRPRSDRTDDPSDQQGDGDSGPEPACPWRASNLSHDASPFLDVDAREFRPLERSRSRRSGPRARRPDYRDIPRVSPGSSPLDAGPRPGPRCGAVGIGRFPPVNRGYRGGQV